ncbi:MAG: DUF1028 domain-containing protein [Anaerolineales bacterium]|nr:DUF1028 domain-containing protein [Anaerolineales bacterium]
MSMLTKRQLAHTYSIVALDPGVGQLGVAVQSHYFGTGSAVPWVGAGVGAVATQSFVEISYGAWPGDDESGQKRIPGAGRFDRC